MRSGSTSQIAPESQVRLPRKRRPMLLGETGSWEVAPEEREKWLSRIVRGESCWTTAMGTKSKWGHIYWWPIVNGIRKTVHAHRFVYFLFNGPIRESMMVLHNCPGGDNPACVNPDHMFLGMDAHNVHDCERKGRGVHPRGERHGRCTTSEMVVRNMLVDVFLHGEKPHNAVRKHGSTTNVLAKAMQGLNWFHVGAEFGIPKKDQAIYRTKVTLPPP